MRHFVIFDAATGAVVGTASTDDLGGVTLYAGQDRIEVDQATIAAMDMPHTWRVDGGVALRKALLSLSVDTLSIPADGVTEATVTATSPSGHEPLLWVNGIVAPPDTWDGASGTLAVMASVPGDIKIMAAVPDITGTQPGDPWHYSDPDGDGNGGTSFLVINAEVPANATD